MSIKGQGHFLTIYFPGFVCTRPRYQVSVYRTIGPLVDMVQHKPGCAATEDGQRLETSDLESRGIALSM